MARRLLAFNNHELIFWSIALILSSSLAIKCARPNSFTQSKIQWPPSSTLNQQDNQHFENSAAKNSAEANKLGELISKTANVDSIYKPNYDGGLLNYYLNSLISPPGTNNDMRVVQIDDPIVKVLDDLNYELQDSSSSKDLIADYNDDDLFDATYYDQPDSNSKDQSVINQNDYNNDDYLVDYYRRLLASFEQKQTKNQNTPTTTTTTSKTNLDNIIPSKRFSSVNTTKTIQDEHFQSVNNKPESLKERIFSDGIEDTNDETTNGTTSASSNSETIQYDESKQGKSSNREPSIKAAVKDPAVALGVEVKEVSMESDEETEHTSSANKSDNSQNSTTSSTWWPSAKSIGSWMSSIFGFHPPGTPITDTITTNSNQSDSDIDDKSLINDKKEKKSIFNNITSYLGRWYGRLAGTTAPTINNSALSDTENSAQVQSTTITPIVKDKVEPGMADHQLMAEMEKKSNNKIVPIYKDSGGHNVSDQGSQVASEKVFTFNQGQKENDDDKESNYNNYSQDLVDQESKIEGGSDGNLVAPIKPATGKSQQDKLPEFVPEKESGTGDVSAFGFLRNYWNKFYDGASRIPNKVDQTKEWPSIQRATNLYGGVHEYPQAPELLNSLRESNLEIRSNSNDGYTQQKLYRGESGIASSESTNHIIYGDGDEAMMSHLDGYSRKYRLPADYGYDTDDMLAADQRPVAPNTSNDLYFIVLVASFCSMAIAVVISAGLFAFRVQQGRKKSSESDYPTYGVVGPSIQNKGVSPFGGGGVSSASKSSGSLKSISDVLSPVENGKIIGGVANNNSSNIADATLNGQRQYQTNQNAARMYHYQHQKQQMLSTDRVSSTRHASASDLDSDEENDEGTYTVYECPGLASTHEMEVKNPLFQDDPTPVGSPTITK